MNGYLVVKRILDLAFSIILIILASPFLLLISLAVKLDSKGPILFRQNRLGKDGKEFVIYKFRTMVENAEKIGTGLFSYKDDVRVTRVGKILRKTSLDELPQLFNIFKGDMSFVGPRPPVTYSPCRYEEYSEEGKRRFTVLPGVTGYAQVKGRNQLGWDEKIKLDIEYIEKLKRWGLWFDAMIVFLTVIKVLTMEGSIDVKEVTKSKGKF